MSLSMRSTLKSYPYGTETLIRKKYFINTPFVHFVSSKIQHSFRMASMVPLTQKENLLCTGMKGRERLN